MRGIAEHHDAAFRPALELDVLEPVVAPERADAREQRAQSRERSGPGIGCQRQRLGVPILVEHGQRDIDRVVAAGRVEHPARSRPVFDGGAGFAATLLRRFRQQETDGAVGQQTPLGCHAEAIAQPGIGAVGGDHQIGADIPSARQLENAVRARGDAFRAEHDLGAVAPRGGGERVDHLLANDAEHPFGRIPAVTREQAVVAVAHLPRIHQGRGRHRLRIGAERLQHTQAVFVDVDAGACGAQPVGPLMDADTPPALRQRAGGGQSGKTRPDDFRTPRGWHA